jgi:hypothetical protein
MHSSIPPLPPFTYPAFYILKENPHVPAIRH